MKTSKKILAVLLTVLLLASSMAVSFTALAADFKLTYDANGGINPPSSQTYISSGEKNISTFQPTREGYTFLGWSTDPYAATAQYQPGGKIMVDSLITLYAVWELTPTASYMLIYNANSGVNPPAAQTFASSGTQTVTTAEPTRDGWTFKGWTTVPGNMIIEYRAGDSIEVTGVVRLYAVWRNNEDNNADDTQHEHLYELNLWDYGAEYFIDTMHEDLFEQYYGETIEQHYAGCRFYYCADCISLYADHGDGRLEYMKNSGEVFYVAGTGFFNEFPAINTKKSYRLLPDHDSAELQDGDYWFDLDGFYANYSPESLADRYEVAAWFGADDMASMLSEDNSILLLMHEHQYYDQGGTSQTYYGFWSLDLTDPANNYLNVPPYLHQHLGTAEHFTLLPTADSDALNNGDYWFDLNGMRDAELAGLDPDDPRYAEGLALYENANVYLSDDGTTVRVLIGDTMFDIVLADNAEWRSFLHQHFTPGTPIEGYTLLPKADSDALNDGDAWYDFDGILAANTHGLDKNAPEYIEVVEAIANAYVYLKNDQTSIKVFFNGEVGDLSPGDPDEAGWMYFVRVHGTPQFNGFTLLPGADSEDLAAGAYWYDKAAYMDSLTQDLDPADEEDAFVIWMYNEIYGKRFYYLSDDGQTLKVYQNPLSMADIARSDADSEECFGFLKQHEAPVEIVNENTGVILTADAGVVPATTVLVVEPAAVDATGIVIEETVNLAERQSLIYDVKLQDGSGNEVQPDGFVTVKIPVPDGYNTDNIKVFYIAPDGAATEIPCTVADGFVSFITNHFSNYAVVDMTCLHNGATEIRGAVTATCKTDGYTGDTYCLGCGEEIATGAVIFKETVAHTPGAAVKENVVNATTDHGGSYDEVVRCTVCGAVISSTHKTTDPLPKPVDPKPENLCKWCGKTHDGFFQKIVGFFHNIFAAIFGAKY